MKKISNQFVVNTVEDGESAPYYFEEWYAWSNDVSTASVTTEPTIDGVWATSIPAQGSYAYLWRKSIRNVWDANSRTYTQETAQYFRMSGENGTSINVKGTINYAYNNSGGFPPPSSSITWYKAVAKEDNRIWICQQVAQNAYDWVPNGGTASDGFSYTIVQGNFNGNYQSTSNLTGHLVMWSTEAEDWVDLGLFKGESGVTYYTHIAWATSVTLSQSELPIPSGQTNRPNALAANISGFSITPLSGVSYAWMGYLIDTNSSDSQVKQNYTWQRNKGEKGDDASEVNPNILLRTIFDNGIDKVKEAWSSNWTVTSIDAATDTIVNGRKSIRLNASSLSSVIDFQQDVYGRIRTSTWYTLSFNYFATQAFYTFIWNGNNSHGIVDTSAGYYLDGVFYNSSLGIDGNHQWPASWTGARHSITFKTKSSFGTTHANVLFRCPAGGQVAICMPKLEDGKSATAYMANEDDLRGEKGDQGDRGKVGRFFYFGGTFVSSDSTQTFIVNDAQAPYFEHTENGQKRYHVFNYNTNGAYTMAQMWAVSDNWNNKPWESMTNDFKYIITEAIFAQFAQFGSAIINGDWMLSTNGTINGVAYNNGALYNGSPAYTWFDPQYPNESVNTAHSVNGKEWTGYNFVPNYAVDLLTGATYQQNAYVNGSVRTKSMSIEFVNIENVYNSDGELQTEFIVGDTTVIYDAQGQAKNIEGVWNFVVGGRTESILLPTNSYANFGQRVILYNPHFSSIDGYVSGVSAVNINYEQETRIYDAIRGVGSETVGTFEHPVPDEDYTPVNTIDWVNGIIELMCVPADDSTKMCDWVVVNIGTNIYRLKNLVY